MTSYLCKHYDIYPMYSVDFNELLHSDICHLLISGVDVNIATDIVCESDGSHCQLAVSRKRYM